MGLNTQDTKIKQEDLVRLEARFVLPVIIQAMLKGEETLDDIAEYAINEMLDEFYPDTSLLCLALCARHIAASTDHTLISKALMIEADNIIQDYGVQWLVDGSAKDLSYDLDHDELLAQLEHIPEDLEALADLFDATIQALDENHMPAAILLDILSEHARWQQSQAEDLLFKLTHSPDLPAHIVAQSQNASDDNVIPFPSERLKK